MDAENTHGGKREGAGRKKGWRKSTPSIVRKQRQLRAFEDEWQIINQFGDIVKKGNRKAAEKFVEKYKME